MLTRMMQTANDLGVKIYGVVLNRVDLALPEYYGYSGYYRYSSKEPDDSV